MIRKWLSRLVWICIGFVLTYLWLKGMKLIVNGLGDMWEIVWM